MISAIICEYNPLHNGHLYHIKETRNKTRCDYLICLMSGDFVQRGEPAVLDKYARSRSALAAGADIVIELPCVFAVSNAEVFAKGAIHLLNSLGFVDTISFGSESGDIEYLSNIAKRLLSQENGEIKTKLSELTKQGVAYPKALATSYELIFGKESAEIFRPNNILAIEYLKALLQSGSKILPFTLKRQGAGHHAMDLDSFASSTAIREALRQKTHAAQLNLPSFSLDSQAVSGIDFEKRDAAYYAILRNKLINASVKSLQSLYDYSEGIEYKIKDSAIKCTTLNEFYHSVKSKRYTMSKIKRLCFYAITELKKEVPKNALVTPPYFNILGIKNSAKALLPSLPLCAILKAKDADKLNQDQNEILNYDITAHNLYRIITDTQANGFFSSKLIVVD